MTQEKFSTVDYVLLVLMLLLSLGIGLYYAVFKKQNSAKEYLHGGKDMNFIAVSLSIVSSIISGVSLISMPTEIYYYGAQYLLTLPTIVIIGISTNYIILPVFYKLQLTSIFEYFEMRFDSKVKIFSSILFAIQMIIYSPLVVYAPGLIVSQVTKINVHLITPILCTVCIVYTVFGGIKAVIWTDALQTLVMIGSMIVVIVMGFIDMGGIANVYNTVDNVGRLFLKFDPDITQRDTFWTITIGNYIHVLGMYGFGQGTIQKYLSLRNYKDVVRTNCIATFGLILVFFLCMLCGFVALAEYVYCDPISTKKIQKPDQIVPFYVMDMGASFPGLPGIFVAGVISAGLSTLSAILNSLAATMYNDFLRRMLPEKIVKRYEATTLKIIVAVLGVVCVSLVYIVEHLGAIMPLFISFLGLTNGPMAGLFFTGMLIPRVNAKGALVGGVISLLFLSWLIFTAQWYKMSGAITYPVLPVYTNNCQEYVNVTYDSQIVKNSTNSSFVNSFYKISHHIYPAFGVIIVIVVSVIISCFTKSDKHFVHGDYLSPVVANYVSRKRREKSGKYHVVTGDIKMNDLQD